MATWRAASALGAALAAASAPAASATLELATLDWPPYYGSELANGGPIAALAKAAAATQGHKVTIDYWTWKRALRMAKRGARDGLLGAYYNADRAKHFYYSEPLYSVTGSFIARSGFERTAYETLRDLQGYRIGYLRGGEYPKTFDRAGYLTKDASSDLTTLIRKLADERVELITMADPVFFDKVDSRAGLERNQFKLLTPPLWRKALYIAVSRQIDRGRDLADALNAGLAELQASGRYREILRRYDLPYRQLSKLTDPAGK